MQSELFPTSPDFERIPMRDAEVYYARRVALGREPAEILDDLIESVDWRTRDIVLWGRKVKQPRLIAWYGDPGRSYAYSGVRLEPAPWTPILSTLRKAVGAAASTTFNSVLLNYYRDESDSMGYHSDDEAELGPQPVIASLSLGEERTFLLKHRTERTVETVRLRPASGSLLLMKGDTQRYWKHALPKRTKACGPRVNLTFRQIQA